MRSPAHRIEAKTGPCIKPGLKFTTAQERIGKGGANFGSRNTLFEYDEKEIKIPPDLLAKSSANALDHAHPEGRQVG